MTRKALKCLIIEDEPLASKQLESYIAQCSDLAHLKTVTDIEDVEAFLPDLQDTDILLLDIHVSGGDVTTLARYISILPYIVCTSAILPCDYPDFVKKRPYFVLTKPITRESFDRCVKKILAIEADITHIVNNVWTRLL